MAGVGVGSAVFSVDGETVSSVLCECAEGDGEAGGVVLVSFVIALPMVVLCVTLFIVLLMSVGGRVLLCCLLCVLLFRLRFLFFCDVMCELVCPSICCVVVLFMLV